MRRLIFVLAVLLPAPSMALRRPSPSEEMQIRYELERGNRALSQDERENPEFAQAIRRKRALDAKMGIPSDGNGDALRVPTESDLDKLHGWFHDDRDEYRRAATVVANAQRVREEHFNAAIQLADKFYGLGPKISEGTADLNSGDAYRGRRLVWAPHYKPSARALQSTSGDFEVGAYIDPASGRAVILGESFSSLHSLVRALRHEAMHQNLMLGTPELNLSKPEEERLIGWVMLGQSEPLGFGTDEYRSTLFTAAGMDWIVRDWKAKYEAGFRHESSPDQFLMEVPSSARSLLESQLGADVSLFDKFVAGTDGIDSFDALKARAQSEFVRHLQDFELEHLVTGWKAARQNDGLAAARESQVALSRIAVEGQACRFTMTPEGDFFSQGVPVFRVYHGGDVDRARAAFLLIDACLGEGRPDDRPCNDAIGIVAARWQEPQFKNAMMKWRTTDPFIDGEGNPGECLLELRDSWTPRGDFADLKATIERNHARRSSGRPKPPAPQTPREPRPPRESPPPSLGDGQCYQSNDGRVICP